MRFLMGQYAIEMSNIQKSFNTIQAVKNGFFNLLKGEIHSLIGENGAGKSTMMKLLYGLYQLDDGTIKVNGEVVEDITPKKAIELGIGMVHQEFMLIDDLTVIENIILGFEPRKGVVIDFEKARKDIRFYIEQYGLDIQLNKKVKQISLGEAQRVEIIKTLMRGAETIILDEPTAVLTPQETTGLFKILNKLKEDEKSIIFISHKLNEVMEISDRISVMRQGEYIGTEQKSDTSPHDLARMMIGRDILNSDRSFEYRAGDTVLQVQNLWTSGEKEISKIRDISFEVREGEILGIAGIDGNGQSELIEAITGLRKVERGSVFLKGKDITNMSPRRIRRSGLSHIPEDRNIRGLNRNLTVFENLIAVDYDRHPFSGLMTIRTDKVLEHADRISEEFDIRPRNPRLSASSLSGGNAQKVVVAREVSIDGDFLIASQPTRGVDIGAIESIHNILRKVRDERRGVLLVSADLEEILSLSDRIIVLYEGKINGELMTRDADESNLGIMMMGGHRKGEDSDGL